MLQLGDAAAGLLLSFEASFADTKVVSSVSCALEGVLVSCLGSPRARFSGVGGKTAPLERLRPIGDRHSAAARCESACESDLYARVKCKIDTRSKEDDDEQQQLA